VARTTGRVLVVATFALATGAQGGEPARVSDLPDLLRRLSEHEAAVALYNLVTRTSTEQELDGDGRVTDESVTVMQVTTRPDRVDTVIVSSTHNGKDATHERQEAVRESHPDDVHIRARSPFNPGELAKYDFKLLDLEAGTGRCRIHFEPKDRHAEGLLVGDAWADSESGTTLRIVATPSKLPSHADKVSMQMNYDAVTPAGPALSKLVVEGEGHFLFFHQRMRATTVVNDYPRVPSP
jgi:hypothetical protein